MTFRAIRRGFVDDFPAFDLSVTAMPRIEKRTWTVGMRFTLREREIIEAAAEAAQVLPSTFARLATLDAARAIVVTDEPTE